MGYTLLSIELKNDHDVVLTRQRARDISRLIGFDNQDQIRIATAVSEIVRNVVMYAGNGTVHFTIDIESSPQMFVIEVIDTGPGISDIHHILSGEYQSKTGMGLGIIGAKKLMEFFTIQNLPEKGLHVTMKRRIPHTVVTPESLKKITEELIRRKPGGLIEELQQQNLELMLAMNDLKQKQEELSRLNQELEDTNRGVVALYTELDEKADSLRRADELKTRFLSNMSHEFRTPLNSVIGLTRILLARTDGDLQEEQEKQVNLIAKSAEDLLGLVNDLLDLAKIEAGKVTVHPTEFTVDELFSTLRGMLKPLLLSPSIRLEFVSDPKIPSLMTDQGRVSQILRNLISNSIKFTEEGEIRITASLSEDKTRIRFLVADTGVGIDPAYHHSLFGEFVQAGNRSKTGQKGTGLGLSIAKRLSELLGGTIFLVTSDPGKGSIFESDIPLILPGFIHIEPPKELQFLSSKTSRILLIDDDPQEHYLYKKYLKDTEFEIIAAYCLKDAEKELAEHTFIAIILDILIPGDDTWAFLHWIKQNPQLKDIPVYISSVVDEQRKGLFLGADGYWIKPVKKEELLEKLSQLSTTREIKRILLIDDDESFRYLVLEYLSDTPYDIISADNGEEGYHIAQKGEVDLILLDLVMPGWSGYKTLEALKGNPKTNPIPVVLITSKILTDDERLLLMRHTYDILSKSSDVKERILSIIEQISIHHLDDMPTPSHQRPDTEGFQ